MKEPFQRFFYPAYQIAGKKTVKTVPDFRCAAISPG
jgi:hypothetical protein